MLKFEQWFDQEEWLHEDTAYERLLEVWNNLMLATGGNSALVIASMDEIVSVMNNEYGN